MNRRFLIVLAVLFAGCYRYEPLRTPKPLVGENVRAHLTLAGTEEVARVLGRDIATLDGRLVSEEAGIMHIAASATVTRSMISTAWTGEEVRIPASSVEKLERRVLDKKRTIRTAFFAVLGAVGVSALIRSLGRDPSGQPPGGGGGPPPA
ncbi:MAG: hypothetical protein ABIZ91_01800 [Gemmatimonadaceae bacterium]